MRQERVPDAFSMRKYRLILLCRIVSLVAEFARIRG